jgi:ActR/RegA family two-component response regulator
MTIRAHIPSKGMDLDGFLSNVEKTHMEKALAIAEGNESQAARLLKMNHHTFQVPLEKTY